MSQDWEESAQAWIAHLGEAGDFSRRYVLDPVMLPRVLSARPTRVLDVGCGEGRFCRMLRREGIACVGLDPTEALLTVAREKDPQGEYWQAGAEAIPGGAAAFDLVLSYVSLVDIPDMPKAILEMARVLKPGGKLLLANLTSFNTAASEGGWQRSWRGKKLHFPIDEYLRERSLWLEYKGIRVRNFHRPMKAYMQALLATGLNLEYFDEPTPREDAPEERAESYRRVPYFWVMEWSKRQG